MASRSRNTNRRAVGIVAVLLVLLAIAAFSLSDKPGTAGSSLSDSASADSNVVEEFTGDEPDRSVSPQSTSVESRTGRPEREDLVSALEQDFGIPTNLQYDDRPQVDLSDPPLHTRLDLLERQANTGDASAALSIAVGISRCSEIITSGQSLEDRVSTLYATRQPHEGLPMVDNLAEYEAMYRKEHAYCAGLDSSHLSKHFEYTLLAAELGDIYAQTNLLSGIGLSVELRDEVYSLVWESSDHMESDRRHHLLQAARSGGVEAMNQIWRDPTLSAQESIGYRVSGMYLELLAGTAKEEYFHWGMSQIRQQHPGFDEEATRDFVRQIVRSDECCRIFQN